MEFFPEGVSVQNADGKSTIILDANKVAVTIGLAGANAQLTVQDTKGRPVLQFKSKDASLVVGNSGNEGDLLVLDGQGNNVFQISGKNATLHIGAKGNEGDIFAHDGDGRIVFHLDGKRAELKLGAEGNSGLANLLNNAGDETITFNAATSNVVVRDADERVVFDLDGANATLRLGTAGNYGAMTLANEAGKDTIFLDAEAGSLEIRDAGAHGVFRFSAKTARLTLGANENDGDLLILDGEGRGVLNFDGDDATLNVGAKGNEGDIFVRDEDDRIVFHLNGGNAVLRVGAAGNYGAVALANDAGKDTISLDAEAGGIVLRDAAQREVFNLDGAQGVLRLGTAGNYGHVSLVNNAGAETITFDAEASSVVVRDAASRTVFNLLGASAELNIGAAGNYGLVRILNDAGAETIGLDGNSGDIVLSNADAAEHFDVAEGAEAAPGTLMVLNAEGRLEPSSAAYDKKVVGVVAGAGEYRPGILLGHRRGGASSRVPISVLGKVCCKADAGYGAVEVGDLLTTSPTVGHAMRAADPLRAFGSVIGKALSPLREGVGSVDVLVTLQ